MRLTALSAASFLLPAGLLAAPQGGDGLFGGADGGNLEVRNWTVHTCTIRAQNYVNCRAGPSIDSDVVATLPGGMVGGFLCVESGECVTIGGNRNCGWDRLYYFGTYCYVSGHYTDAQCGVAKLGMCSESED
ncbi:hypothetical protein VTK26DRAFT_9148 [Humicola hyalothermophila]